MTGSKRLHRRQTQKERNGEIIHTFGLSPTNHSKSNIQDTGQRSFPNSNQPLK